MKIAICDESEEVREEIKNELMNEINTYYYPQFLIDKNEQIEIICFEFGKTLFSGGQKFDLIFLNTKINGMDGIKLAKKLRQQERQMIFQGEKTNKIEFIFIAEQKEQMQEAFDVNAFHYLMKPIKKKKLIEVFRSYLEKYNKIGETNESFLFIKTGSLSRRIDLKDIYYIDTFRKKVTLYLKQGSISYYAKLEELEKQLRKQFFRCHRSYLVNLAYVVEYDATTVVLEGGQRILMAKQKYSIFTKAYLEYLNQGIVMKKIKEDAY